MEEIDKKYFLEILKKYRLGKATSQEIEFLEAYYNVFDLNEDAVNDENEKDHLLIKASLKNRIDQRIILLDNKTNTRSMRNAWIKYAAAAAILIFCTIGAYFLLHTNQSNLSAQKVNDVAPGGNKAMLTLANGTRIILDDAQKGKIAQQSGITITKTADGQIVYNTTAESNELQDADHIPQNVFSTPKGGQYKIILPDGTSVLLNAASSLTYPAFFHGNERAVTLVGEAYFEVAKNKKMPFRVHSGMQTVEVLGTHFNINAYADEKTIKTTLAEGSVKVSTDGGSILIVPGQQTVVHRSGNGAISTLTVDMDKELAWKNGVFAFENDDLNYVMRQISRWYDVDVVYADNLPDDKFFGEISRNSNLTEVFKILELNNFKFDIKGKTVKVSYNNTAP